MDSSVSDERCAYRGRRFAAARARCVGGYYTTGSLKHRLNAARTPARAGRRALAAATENMAAGGHFQ
ncbi:hypothetical protein [Burkholderia thailandensis]|uniref:hypothetical protein n=1 Tax=Burkholderia thailandensis TaxID=57975 RepID=UPI001390DF75|nr:hypothetical protein [Burkholderia thailandensis]MCS3397660.1 hypothetical protein [Burkholderia thailandensis]MCS6470779.1 hypothetical protein [Burkholderia thailandensis]MCS6477231.1 hypothetical protein [Burkholderia thailandensis]MCS6496089.1 hypothetical protein [Burkholderia thailandensis]MCS6503682.1 hypothetical protein [Burkholderia thailandensis]